MDKIYFLVRVTLSKQLVLYLYCNYVPLCITGYKAHNIFSLLLSYESIKNLSIDHIFYLSKELIKAEIVMFLGQKFIQE